MVYVLIRYNSCINKDDECRIIGVYTTEHKAELAKIELSKKPYAEQYNLVIEVHRLD